ncbi:MAG TPA: hypothetical protein VGE62_02045 [Candidatus Paceibacterota bacterium]
MNLDSKTAPGGVPEEPKPAPGLLSFDGGGLPLALNSAAAHAAVRLAGREYELAVKNGLV